MWRRGNPCMLLEVMQIGTATVENSMEGPKKTAHRTTIGSNNSTSWYIQTKELKPGFQRAIIFTATLFVISNTWKQPPCPLTDE